MSDGSASSHRGHVEAAVYRQREGPQYVKSVASESCDTHVVHICVCVCLRLNAGSGAASGPFNQSVQPPAGATPPPPQPVMGLAQTQTNNSNNKTGTYPGATRTEELALPDDLQRLMDDWAREVLIVSHRPRTNSLSISGQQLCGPAASPQPATTSSDVSLFSYKYLLGHPSKVLSVHLSDPLDFLMDRIQPHGPPP